MTEPAAPGLAAALSALQAELPTVVKDKTATVTSQRTGRTHSYTYANLATVTEKILPLLSKHGLAFMAKPTLLPEGQFVLSYALLHGATGEAERGLYPLPTTDSPQAMGSAITYARRYCLCAVTGVASDDDDDGQAAEMKRDDGLPVNADGSLSRSRTTDAEKDAAGVMTSAQQAEHTALQPKRAELAGKVSRLRPESPPEDPWSGPASGAPTRPGPRSAPATVAPDDVPLEDRPGSIGPKQRSQIMAAYGKMPRDERAVRLGALVGREVASTNDLSYSEAARVLAEIGAAK